MNIDALWFSLNAVLPTILLAIFGFIIKRLGLISDNFLREANKLCFSLLLPTRLFLSVYLCDSIEDINWPLIAYCCAGLFVIFLIGMALTPLAKERNRKGVLVQAVFRSNFSMVGLPMARAICGPAGELMAASVTLFAVPLNNILAVVALRKFQHTEKEHLDLRALIIDLVRNPLILGVFTGILSLLVRMVFAHNGVAFRLSDISPLYAFIETIASLATPLAIIVLGAQIRFTHDPGAIRLLSLATVMRLIIAPVIAIGTALICFRSFGGPELGAILALFASPCAAASAIMAGQMGGDTEFAAQTVMVTTALSAFTMFLFAFFLRSAGLV